MKQKASIIKRGKKHIKNTIIKTGRKHSITLDLGEDSKYYARRNKTGRGNTVVWKSGNVNNKAVRKIFDQIDDSDLSLGMKIKLKNEVVREIKNYQADIKAGVRKTRVTEQTLESRMMQSKTDKMLINAGYSRESFAKEYKLKADDIYNASFYDDGKNNYMKVGNRTFKYEFNYNGSMFEEVK